MREAVTVTVEAINDDYGYTIVEVAPTRSGRFPLSFVIHYEPNERKYYLSQTGENNEWICNPDERK